VSNWVRRSSIKASVFAFIILLLAFSVLQTQKRVQIDIRKAIIIDPLSDTYSEIEFTDECRNLLLDHGYKVEIISGENVTVQKLKNLNPDYKIAVFRTHSSVFDEGVWLFTGELFDNTKYVMDQLSGEVHLARRPGEARLLFAIGSDFVEHYMTKNFEGALIILMGCDSLGNEGLAQTFVDKGAIGVVGWSGPVNLSYTDQVVLTFLQNYLNGMDLNDSTKNNIKDNEHNTSTFKVY